MFPLKELQVLGREDLVTISSDGEGTIRPGLCDSRMALGDVCIERPVPVGVA